MISYASSEFITKTIKHEWGKKQKEWLHIRERNAAPYNTGRANVSERYQGQKLPQDCQSNGQTERELRVNVSPLQSILPREQMNVSLEGGGSARTVTADVETNK